MKTKKVINPNLMFTMFTTFGERSPGELRKEMVEWIEANLESFKQHVFIAMASRDIDFDMWFSNVKSNDYIGDEFCLSALCQLCQRHALVVTSTKVWTTIPPSFQKTDDETRRLCDIHLLYVCKDTYSMLKPVFEWKRKFPIGEVSLVMPDDGEPLKDTTDKVLSKELSEQNVGGIKLEADAGTSGTQDQFRFVDIPPLPDTDHPLPDATVNQLVELPGSELTEFAQMDATPLIPTLDEHGAPIDATPPVDVDGDDEPIPPSHVIQPVQN